MHCPPHYALSPIVISSVKSSWPSTCNHDNRFQHVCLPPQIFSLLSLTCRSRFSVPILFFLSCQHGFCFFICVCPSWFISGFSPLLSWSWLSCRSFLGLPASFLWLYHDVRRNCCMFDIMTFLKFFPPLCMHNLPKARATPNLDESRLQMEAMSCQACMQACRKRSRTVRAPSPKTWRFYLQPRQTRPPWRRPFEAILRRIILLNSILLDSHPGITDAFSCPKLYLSWRIGNLLTFSDGDGRPLAQNYGVLDGFLRLWLKTSNRMSLTPPRLSLGKKLLFILH